MKKISAVFMAALIMIMLAGCDLWMNGEFQSITPHRSNSAVGSSGDAEVSSYAELQKKLTQIVAEGRESYVIYYPSVDSSALDKYMESAIDYVIRFTPVGAYAVSGITYESGTNTGKQAVAVTVTYNHGRPEILRIRQAADMEAACTYVASALKYCEAGVTIQVEEYKDLDMLQYVQDYVDQHPDECMEMPQVTASVYPEQGAARIIELSFSYQTSRDDLRQMQQTVSPIFNSAELYVSGDGEAREKYLQLYAFLMERHDYEIQTSITPAYHLLRHGVGDCKAFAAVYAAMCRRAGLDCQVVTGTRAGESWYWNAIFMDGTYYYVDLLACNERGSFSARPQEEMDGYVWDYDLFQTDATE